jgi:hypothetical protein
MKNEIEVGIIVSWEYGEKVNMGGGGWEMCCLGIEGFDLWFIFMCYLFTISFY